MVRSLLAALLTLGLVGAAPPTYALPILAVRHAQDPGTVLIATDGVDAYDVETGVRRWRLAPPPSGRTRVIAPLHHAPAALVGNDDGEVLLVDTRTGEVLRRLWAAATPAPSDAHGLYRLDPRTGEVRPEPSRAADPSVVAAGWLLGAAVSAGDQLAAAVKLGGEVALWRLADGERMPLPDAARGARLEGAAFTADARTLLLVGRYDTPDGGEVLRAVDLLRGSVRGYHPGAEEGCRHGQSVALAPAEDRVAVGCFGGRLSMLAWPSLKPLWSTVLSVNWTGPVAFEPRAASAEPHLVVMTAESVLRMDAATGRIVARSEPESGSGATNELSLHPAGTEVLHGERTTGRLVRRALPSLDLLSERVMGE